MWHTLLDNFKQDSGLQQRRLSEIIVNKLRARASRVDAWPCRSLCLCLFWTHTLHNSTLVNDVKYLCKRLPQYNFIAGIESNAVMKQYIGEGINDTIGNKMYLNERTTRREGEVTMESMSLRERRRTASKRRNMIFTYVICANVITCQ